MKWKIIFPSLIRRGGRVVEGARLESVYTSNRIKGSNPFLSAILKKLNINTLRHHLLKNIDYFETRRYFLGVRWPG